MVQPQIHCKESLQGIPKLIEEFQKKARKNRKLRQLPELLKKGFGVPDRVSTLHPTPKIQLGQPIVEPPILKVVRTPKKFSMRPN